MNCTISSPEHWKVTARDKTGNRVAERHVYGKRGEAEKQGRALLKHTPMAATVAVTDPMKNVR